MRVVTSPSVALNDTLHSSSLDSLIVLSDIFEAGLITPRILRIAEPVRYAHGIRQQNATITEKRHYAELNALLFALNHSHAQAAHAFQSLLASDDHYAAATPTVARWSAYYTNPSTIAKLRRKRIRRHIGVSLGLVVTVAVIGLSAWGVYAAIVGNSDEAVIARADPSMVALADKAHMNQRGKAMFLRADPSLVSRETLLNKCGSAFVGGGVEFGCYDPVASKIYIRDMPERFDSEEVSTAAHEMLHAVYAGDFDTTKVDKLLTAHVAALPAADPFRERMSVYKDLDAAALADEYHSIIPTEGSNLSDELRAYYAQYFTDTARMADAYAQTEATFKQANDKLTALDTDITKLKTESDTLYSRHLVAADQGSQRLSDTYYSQYLRVHNAMNSKIEEYGTLATEYNELVAQYSGVPVEQLPTAEPAE